MKKQIKRLSPHQNGKVFGVLTAVASLILMVPMFLLATFAMPPVDQHGHPVVFPAFAFLLFPIFYLVFGYIFVAIGCAFYNVIVRMIGGFEFEVTEVGE